MRNGLLILLFTCFLLTSVNAQDTARLKKHLEPLERFYLGSSFDGAIFSSALIQQTSLSPATTTNSTGTIRFSWFFNFGCTFNYNLSRHLGAYTGIDVKNVGYIDKNSSASTEKRRTYNVGVPVGIKVGNMTRKRGYVFLGGGVDVPVNYKEKQFANRAEKDVKFNEWFSPRTPAFMPYLFAGAVMYRGLSFKAQYYPGNFLNPDFTKNGVQPYAGTDVHLMLFSIGLSVRYGRHKDLVAKNISELRTM